ncbi:MAG TPA: SSI family serine proteinase inhibitor [Candidatus Limnocylindrales bacterium]
MVTMFALVTALLAPVQPQLSYTVSLTDDTGKKATVTLECGPVGGTHPKKKKACRQLLKAGGRIEEIPPRDGVCTMEYAPVIAHAEGGGYRFEKEYSNRCNANLSTGGYLFDLDLTFEGVQTLSPGALRSVVR